jgi:5-methylcytosine-specific restriction endonuclease McrA
MMKRPKIPADVAREVLIEAGHRCACCGMPCSVQRAHIIPWSRKKSHDPKDLVALCANCHGLSHKDKWDVKTLREYKRHPWVFKHFGREVIPPLEQKRRDNDIKQLGTS